MTQEQQKALVNLLLKWDWPKKPGGKKPMEKEGAMRVADKFVRLNLLLPEFSALNGEASDPSPSDISLRGEAGSQE